MQNTSKLAGLKKLECDIPPLIYHNDIVYGDSDKAEVFDKKNSEQYNVNDHNKSLPTDDPSTNHCLIILFQDKYHSQVKI